MANLGFGGVQNAYAPIVAGGNSSQAPYGGNPESEDQMRARVAEYQRLAGNMNLSSINTSRDGTIGMTGMTLDQLSGGQYKDPGAQPGNLGFGSPASGGFVAGPTGTAQAAPSGNSTGAPGANPYLDQMAQGITSQMNENWTRNLAPSIRSGAMATGGFGGSRQGVVEANALNDLNRSLGQNLTSLYGTDWTNSQNRGLQQQQITNQNNQFGLGLDSQNAQFGANLGLNTMNAQNQWAQNGVNAANQMQQTPINYFGNFSGNANQIAGQGGTTSQTNPGNPYLSALGGVQLASSLYK